ncbi:MAG: hypothetical protein HOH37_00945 [Gammaproteobacteria bacterium]|nr:hypothetical protein [Gammaproteobacteria bacterium]
MQSLPVNIYSVAPAQQIDRISIGDHEIPGYTLMQRAGVVTVGDELHARAIWLRLTVSAE